MKNLEYAGFWIRVLASLIDTFIMLLILLLLIGSIYGFDSTNMEMFNGGISYNASSYSFNGNGNFFINFLFTIIVIAFWLFKSATPGKMLTKLTIVDANTGEKPTVVQFVLRYVGYFLSSIFFLGFIWIAFDKRKQGWHDMIARTVVIRDSSVEEVKFEE